MVFVRGLLQRLRGCLLQLVHRYVLQVAYMVGVDAVIGSVLVLRRTRPWSP